MAWTSDIDEYKFLSTPSVRRATIISGLSGSPAGISIHALREEGDNDQKDIPAAARYFYPRPP